MMTDTPLPQLRLDFYETAVLLSRWEKDGRLVSHPVAVEDVVGACTRTAVGSGLLPADTLFWRRAGSGETLGVYAPATRRRVQTAARSYHLPLPPLLFVGGDRRYRVFAVKRRPQTADAQLYHAPCPNVYGDGRICQGETPFPPCTAETVQAALTLFWEGSLFNGDLSRGKCRSYPDDVRRLWAELDGRRRFPLSELAPAQLTMASLMS